MACFTAGEMVSRMHRRMLTQYKESTNFKAFIEVFGLELEAVQEVLCSMYAMRDIDTAEGDALDEIGEGVGWPRCHCLGEQQPVFGFSTGNPCCDPGNVVGWCEGNWGGLECGGLDYRKDYCFDDALYRVFIKAKMIKNRSNGNPEDVITVAQLLFGNDASILSQGGGKLDVMTGRYLTTQEKRIIDLYKEVIPSVRGVKLRIVEVVNPFGFGTGWGEWCTGNFGKVYS